MQLAGRNEASHQRHHAHGHRQECGEPHEGGFAMDGQETDQGRCAAAEAVEQGHRLRHLDHLHPGGQEAADERAD